MVAVLAACRLHLIIRDDPWVPGMLRMHRRSGLRSIWIFKLAPAGDEGATSTTHTCDQERKPISTIVDTTLHRCDGRRPEPLVFGD